MYDRVEVPGVQSRNIWRRCLDDVDGIKETPNEGGRSMYAHAYTVRVTVTCNQFQALSRQKPVAEEDEGEVL